MGVSRYNEDEDNFGKFRRSVSRQFMLGLLTNFTNIAPSMALGFSAVALPALTKSTNPYVLTSSQASWFASITSLATPFGCILAGPIADRFGRRTALFVVNIVCFIGWLILAGAYFLQEQQYPILLVGRLVTGLSTGLSSVPATIYMAEISSPKLRGVLTTLATISFAIGILIVYMLGWAIQEAWGIICLITAVFPCFGILFNVLFIPESPSWLITKNRINEAKENMCYVFGAKDYIPEVQSEIETLIQRKGVKTTEKASPLLVQLKKKLQLLGQPSCYKPLAIIITFFFFQQLSGTFSIVFYAISIVKDAGVKIDEYVAIVLIGAVRLISAMFLSFITKKFGRRPLSIVSGLGMAVCMCLLGGYILLIEQGKVTSEYQNKLSFLPVLLLLLYFFTSTLGFLPLPFAMSAELYPTKIRGTASGLSSGSGYFFNFIIVKVYPDMVTLMYKQGVFFFYGAMAFAGAVFVIFFLPETKGKSLQEIEERFAGKRKSIEEA